ncbi:carbohydrate ABC transporter permease [Nonomuraea sp. MTCD27]|uniref:carbohydrate ABC transporter permease n=1 Tax=Nonomuraea sp. MTCD27 TaxID=1676747 RepID=UPI0035C0FEC9
MKAPSRLRAPEAAASRSAEPGRSSRRTKLIASRAVAYATMALLAVPFVVPGLWMLSASLKPNSQIFAYPPTLWPSTWQWSNYVEIFTVQPFARQYGNSLYIAVVVTAVTVFTSSLAGFAFARLRFRGSGPLFLVLMSGFFIPEEVTLIPLYKIIGSLGLMNTHVPLILMPIFSGTGVVATFIMRQAFLAIPRELQDAARVDGLDWFGTYWRIALPLVRPSIGVVIVLAALNSWNMFLEPLVFLRDNKLFTLPVALTQYEDAYTGPMWNLQMAASSVTLITILIVFIAAQRQIIAGLTQGSIKG